MSEFAEYTLLFSILALAGMAIMTNVKVELWCELWLERILMQPLSNDPIPHVSSKRKAA